MKTVKSENVPINEWLAKPFVSEVYYLDFPYIGMNAQSAYCTCTTYNKTNIKEKYDARNLCVI